MLADIPAVFILVGLIAYTVLAGADFGVGLWTLLPAGGTGRAAIHDHSRHAMAPVWEANHVWLIFVLVVCWTAYPVAFGSIASTLAAPLFLAAVGIILRGTSYALRGLLDQAPGRRLIEHLFALSSVLTPFALGTVAGALASGRVPVGNAAGNLVTSWLNPTSILIGTLAVATSSYLAAVYLAADAHRLGEPDLERAFRSRALWAGAVAGALAVTGLLVVRVDAPTFWHGLTRPAGLVLVGVSAAAGLATLGLVRRRRFGPGRVCAALAVAAVVTGWAVAQHPWFLSGLTVHQAAANRSTLLAVVIAVAVGAAVLLPSLLLLFGLLLRGRFDTGTHPASPMRRPPYAADRSSRPLGALAIAGLLVGVGLAVLADPGWLLAVGVVCLFVCAGAAFVLASTGPDHDG